MPPLASQIPGKYLYFLVTRATEKRHLDPENLFLSLTRLTDFPVESVRSEQRTTASTRTVPADTRVTIQDVDRESMKYRKNEREDASWTAQEGRLLIPSSNCDLISGMRSTGTSMDIFVRGVGVGLTHTENLIKQLRLARETGDLEAETGEDPKKPDIGRVVESYLNLPNENSSSIKLTYSDFILTNRTCAIAIPGDMSFKTALAADFKREYKNIEFLWNQRPGLGGVAALPPLASQIPGKYLYFLVTRATEKRHLDPENLYLSLTRLTDFLVESVRSKQRTTASTKTVRADTRVTIQDVDRESMKYRKNEREDPSWTAQEGRLLIPSSNRDLISGMRSAGTSMDIFVRGVGVGLTHTENLKKK